MPDKYSSLLLRQSNLVSQLDSAGNATSMLLHSAFLRVFFDAGLFGVFVVFWTIKKIYDELSIFMALPLIGQFIASGFSVGSFFNPLGAFAMLISVWFLSGYSAISSNDAWQSQDFV